MILDIRYFCEAVTPEMFTGFGVTGVGLLVELLLWFSVCWFPQISFFSKLIRKDQISTNWRDTAKKTRKLEVIR